MRIAIALAILCLAAFTAHAVSYSNDTNSVDIDYQGPAPIGAPDSNLPEGTNGSGDGTDPSTPANSGGTDAVTVTVSVDNGNGGGAPGAGGATAGGTAGTSTGGDTGSSGSTVTGEDILNSLFGNQALSISGGSGGSGGGDYSIRLNGKKAREALKARGISKLSVQNRFTSKFLSKKDFALSAASRILENENIEEVILSLNIVQLTYRSQGRLFAVFPFAFPVTVAVNPYGETPETRVSVKFPWYSFFLQKYVSKAVLIRDINAAIQEADITEVDSIDAHTGFLSAITQVISLRTDTVEGTLR